MQVSVPCIWRVVCWNSVKTGFSLSHLTNEENHGASKGRQFCSLVMDLVLVAAKSCLTLCGSVDCSMLGFPVLHCLLEFTKIHVNELVMLPNHLILCPLLILPSMFPSIREFSSESALCIRWPKYWSFCFSISPSTEYSGLISFRIQCW